MYEVIDSQKKELTLNHWNESFLKRIPSHFMLTQSLAYCPPTCWSFWVGLNKNADSFFTTRYCFWSGKNSGFSGNSCTQSRTALTNTALSAEPILPIRRIRKLRGAPKHQGAPCSQRCFLIWPAVMKTWIIYFNAVSSHPLYIENCQFMYMICNE